MTREAKLLIDMWNILHRECHKVVTEENYDVIKKAIKALEQESNCSEIPTGSTTRNCFGCKYSKDDHNAGTEECHLCMWENQYTPTTKNDLGVDCVSRQAVEALVWEYLKKGTDETIAFYENFLDLPSVTPIRPKGRWIYDYTAADGHKTYHCSECGCYLQPKHSEPLNSFKWCSLCGADMREVEDE